MNNKRLVIGMMLAMAVLLGWPMVVNQLYKLNPQWKRPGPTENAATQPATNPTANPATQAAATAPTTNVTAATQGQGAPPSMSASPVRIILPASEAVVVNLGEMNDALPVELRISSQGAGLDAVILKDFKDVAAKGQYIFQQPLDPHNPGTRALATRTIIVDGVIVDVAGVHWNLESKTARSATFMLDLGVVRVRKTFEITDRESASKGFEVRVSHSFENTTPKPVTVKLAFNGPELPPREVSRGPDRAIIGGYDDSGEVHVEQHLVEEFTKEKPNRDIVKSGKDLPLLWAGTSSVYFDAIVRPEPIDGSNGTPKYMTKVFAEATNPESDIEDRLMRMTFETGDLAVDPGKPLAVGASAFFGPKQRELLTKVEWFSAFPRSYDRTLVVTGGLCGFCTFQPLINLLVGMLRGFHFITRDWGLAIIILVCIVRILLHPITKKSQISMSKMSKMGPEMERIKKKYADDKDEMNKALWEFQKTHGFTPVLGCLPMFLQMPIWIALWSALNSTFELRQAPFLWGYTWIDDLAKPDHLIYFPAHALKFTLPLIGKITIDAFNILPVFLGIVFYLQQKFQPKPPAQTKEQEQQMKMMQWMSLLFPLFLYSGPSGLNLYILTSTTIGIIESKRIRDHIKERDEAEKAGKIFVDAKPTRAGKKKSDKPDEPKKKGLMGWLAEQQAKIEQMREQKGK